jgi:hypothetical protein
VAYTAGESGNLGGRPKGRKEKVPRIRRADVLNANREQWDRWISDKGVLQKVQDRLLSIIQDDKVKTREHLEIARIILSRTLGSIPDGKEQQPTQTLVIVRPDTAPALMEPEVEVVDIDSQSVSEPDLENLVRKIRNL